jgi:hypothetical protein
MPTAQFGGGGRGLGVWGLGGFPTSLGGLGAPARRQRLGGLGYVGPWWQPGVMRPALKSGLLPVWRDRDTLQIGIDPRRAIAMSGMGQAALLIGLLDGSRDRDQVIAAAASGGIPSAATERVLTLLAAGGALDDFPASTLRALPPPLRAKLASELATTSLARRDGDGGARALARRRAAIVSIEGDRRIGRAVARILSSSGIKHVGYAGPLADSQAGHAGQPGRAGAQAASEAGRAGPASQAGRAARPTRPDPRPKPGGSRAEIQAPKAGGGTAGPPRPPTWSFWSGTSRRPRRGAGRGSHRPSAVMASEAIRGRRPAGRALA